MATTQTRTVLVQTLPVLILHHLLVTTITVSLAIPEVMITPHTYHYNDVLWDGKQCVGSKNNCCTNPDMPWFFRQLVRPVQGERLEVRNCHWESGDNEDTYVERLELYVQ